MGSVREECIETFIVFFSRESFDVLRFETAHGAHPPPGCHWELQIYPFSENAKVSVKKVLNFLTKMVQNFLTKTFSHTYENHNHLRFPDACLGG